MIACWKKLRNPLVPLALLALAVRLAAVLALAAPEGRPVTYEHGAIAENLLAGKGFSIWFLGTEGPTSQQAPLYPWLLAGLYWVFGSATPQALFAMQCLQCLAGTGVVLAVVWLCRSLIPAEPSVAWAAGWGAALYPPHVYMVSHIQVAVWAALLLVSLQAFVVSPRWRGTRGGAIGAGVLSGLLLLVDPILALALPIAAISFWLGSRAPRQSWFSISPVLKTGLMALVALAVVAPWLLRNYLVHGEFVFIKTTFGYAFWQGNNPASFGTDKIPKPTVGAILAAHDGSLAGRNQALWEARHETLYIDDVLLKPDGYLPFAGLSEPARSRRLGDEARRFIQAEPDRYFGLCMQRLRYLLLFDETNPKTANPVYRASTVVWLTLAVLGLLVSGPHCRVLWPTFATFAAITLFHTLTIASARFRLPIEPLSFVWAGLAVGPLAARLSEELALRLRRRKELSPVEVSEPVILTVGQRSAVRVQERKRAA